MSSIHSSISDSAKLIESASATEWKTKELKKRYEVWAKRELLASALEAVSRASGSPFSASRPY